MPTTAYTNWLTKTRECGLTNEQACGLAMLYAWTLTRRESADDVPDTESFWTFIEKDEFDRINGTAFTIDDFVNLVPEIKLAGEILKVPIGIDRKDSDGNPTRLLDLKWSVDPDNKPHVDTLLLYRHRFDMMWCQRVGECLREEIRTPHHAYAFASYVTHGFQRFDPEGFARILDALLKKKTPFALTFCSKYFIKNMNGFQGYEPIQIALLGFLNSLNPELSEQLWTLQRVLFYTQPGGVPVNADKQYLPTSVFIEFAMPVLENFIAINKTSYLNTGRLVASEYVLKKSGDQQLLIQLHETMETRYKLLPEMTNESSVMRILLNAVAFYTMCCLCIKNLTNQISDLPSLRMADDTGLLWARSAEPVPSLREDAFQCFNVMMSWRLGVAWCLFLETDDGFIQRIYIDGQSEVEDVEHLFIKVCTAYKPMRCVLALFTGGQPQSENDSNPRYAIAFLCLDRNLPTGIDIFQCETDINRGHHLGEYLGYSEDERFFNGAFEKLRNAFTIRPSQLEIKTAQEDLIAEVPFGAGWRFAGPSSR